MTTLPWLLAADQVPPRHTQHFYTSHLSLTLFVRSSSMSAIIPFFTLRSAFVTLKGFGRGTRPDRSCWVMEALADTLAVTHLRKRCKTSGHQLIYFKKNFLKMAKELRVTTITKHLLGEVRWREKAEWPHRIIHMRTTRPAIISMISVAARLHVKNEETEGDSGSFAV